MATFSSFTVSTAPASGDHIIGYATAAAGGERRVTHQNLFKLDDTAAATGLILGTTTPGSITGASGAITLTGAGTNQNITLTPSGTGSVLVTGTKTLKFGATAAATVGVSADTTAGVMTFTSPSAGDFSFTGGIVRAAGSIKRVTTQFDKTSDTTLANITELSVTVAASTSYRFRAVLFTSSAATGGVKFSIGGTATATNVIYEAVVDSGAAIVAETRATALGTAVGGVTSTTAAFCIIEGSIAVNAGGTLTAQFAQNASDVTASSVLVGSYLEVLGF